MFFFLVVFMFVMCLLLSDYMFCSLLENDFLRTLPQNTLQKYKKK